MFRKCLHVSMILQSVYHHASFASSKTAPDKIVYSAEYVAFEVIDHDAQNVMCHGCALEYHFLIGVLIQMEHDLLRIGQAARDRTCDVAAAWYSSCKHAFASSCQVANINNKQFRRQPTDH